MRGEGRSCARDTHTRDALATKCIVEKSYILLPSGTLEVSTSKSLTWNPVVVLVLFVDPLRVCSSLLGVLTLLTLSCNVAHRLPSPKAFTFPFLHLFSGAGNMQKLPFLSGGLSSAGSILPRSTRRLTLQGYNAGKTIASGSYKWILYCFEAPDLHRPNGISRGTIALQWIWFC